MPLSRKVLERQLTVATADLKQRTATLAAAGVQDAAQRLDPQWRQLNAQCSAVRRRLAAVAAVEANNAELEQRKTAGDDAESTDE
jgi:hypothetical protein